jgi:biopolymer transport protein ExbD
MRVRRLRKEAAHLEITAFINLIVVLVPFLLSTAVFTRLSVLDVSLPAQNSGVEQLKAEDLKLEVVIRPDSLEVGDRIGGLIQSIPNVPAARNAAGTPGAAMHDVKALSTLMVQIKAKFPDKTDSTVLAEPDTPYDTLVQVMDAMREAHTVAGPKVTRAELFPNISIGDAPVVKPK